MRLATLGTPGPVPGRRPQQRVPEGQDDTNLVQHPGSLVHAPRRIQAAISERAGDRGQHLVVTRRGEQDCCPATGRQAGELLLVQVPEPSGNRHRRGQRGRAGALHRGEHPAALEQGQRVARGLDGQLVGDHRGEVSPEQLGGVAGRQSSERLAFEVFDGRSRTGARPPSQQEGDAVVPQPAGREQQRVGGLPIQPGQVVDDDEQRLRLGGRGEQAQGCRSNGEAVTGRFRLGPAHGGLQGVPLGLRERRHVAPQRRHDGEQAGMGQHGVRLHSLDPDGGPAISGRRADRRLDQCSLADTRLALDHQHAEGAVPGRGAERGDPVQHLSAADQARRSSAVVCGNAHDRTVELSATVYGVSSWSTGA